MSDTIIEDLKEQAGFHEKMYSLIFSGDPRSESNGFRVEVIQILRKEINPHIVAFFSNGADEIPTSIFDGPRTRGRKYNDMAKIESFSVEFVGLYYQSVRNEAPDTREFKRVKQKLTSILMEVVTRKTIGYLYAKKDKYP